MCFACTPGSVRCTGHLFPQGRRWVPLIYFYMPTLLNVQLFTFEQETRADIIGRREHNRSICCQWLISRKRYRNSLYIRWSHELRCLTIWWFLSSPLTAPYLFPVVLPTCSRLSILLPVLSFRFVCLFVCLFVCWCCSCSSKLIFVVVVLIVVVL